MHGFYSFWDGPGLRAGVGAADFLHVRHPIPQSRFASVGGCKPRSRPCGLLANQGRAAVSRSIGPAGVGGSPAAVRVVGESGWGGDVPVCQKPGARVCRIKRVSVCPAVGRQSDADTGVGRPESGGADECRVAFGRMPGLPGYAWVSQPNRAVGLPERGACCGYGRSAVLARKNEGSPERLPSPSKINP